MHFSGIYLDDRFSYAAAGLFGHPNTMAFIYTITIPILIYKYFTNQYPFYKFIILMFILVIGLLYTFSRAGYIGCCIAILVFAYKRSKKIFLLTVFILLIAFLNLFLIFSQSKGDSSYPRMLLVLTAIDMIFYRGSTFMLWGYGIFNNIKVFTSDKLFFGSTEQVVNPHNLFLLLSIQFGVLFTLSLFVLFVLIILKAFLKKKYLNFRFSQRTNLGLFVLLGLFFQNMLEDIVVYPEFFVMPLFLIFLGYLYLIVYQPIIVSDG